MFELYLVARVTTLVNTMYRLTHINPESITMDEYKAFLEEGLVVVQQARQIRFIGTYNVHSIKVIEKKVYEMEALFKLCDDIVKKNVLRQHRNGNIRDVAPELLNLFNRSFGDTMNN